MTPRRGRSARRVSLAVTGGTFDGLHAGHRALLGEAFRVADRVGIGLTTPGFLARHPKPLARRIRSFEKRRRALERFLRGRYRRRKWCIVPLDDPWGRSVEPDAEALVVSRETEAVARAVNVERQRRGLRPLRVRIVPPVLAQDLRPVASRRIRAGEIDLEGRRRGPVRVGVVGWRGPRETLLSALRPNPLGVPVRVEFGDRRTRLPVRHSASTEGEHRASRRALRAATGRDFGIGIAPVPVRSRKGGRRLGALRVALASAEAAADERRPEFVVVAPADRVPARVASWFRARARRAHVARGVRPRA